MLFDFELRLQNGRYIWEEQPRFRWYKTSSDTWVKVSIATGLILGVACAGKYYASEFCKKGVKSLVDRYVCPLCVGILGGVASGGLTYICGQFSLDTIFLVQRDGFQRGGAMNPNPANLAQNHAYDENRYRRMDEQRERNNANRMAEERAMQQRRNEWDNHYRQEAMRGYTVYGQRP